MAATIAKAGGTTICRYLTINDSTAVGGEWYAANSTEGTNVTGWTFATPTTSGGAGARTASRDRTRGSAANRGNPGRGTRGT